MAGGVQGRSNRAESRSRASRFGDSAKMCENERFGENERLGDSTMRRFGHYGRSAQPALLAAWPAVSAASKRRRLCASTTMRLLCIARQAGWAAALSRGALRSLLLVAVATHPRLCFVLPCRSKQALRSRQRTREAPSPAITLQWIFPWQNRCSRPSRVRNPMARQHDGEWHSDKTTLFSYRAFGDPDFGGSGFWEAVKQDSSVLLAGDGEVGSLLACSFRCAPSRIRLHHITSPIAFWADLTPQIGISMPAVFS
jgi:hypothetical protein